MLRRYGLEIALAIAIVCFAWAWFAGGVLSQLLLGLLAGILGTVVAIRWGRAGIRLLIWRLRNRLIVAYIFISLIPILMVTLLTIYGAKYLGGQVAVYLVNAELDRRVSALEGAAQALARVRPDRRSGLLDRFGTLFQNRFPNLQVILEEQGLSDPGAPPEKWGPASGIVVHGKLLYLWARAVEENARVTLLAPVSRRWLADLSPGLGHVSIIHFPIPGSSRVLMRLHDSEGLAEDAQPVALPSAVNTMDFEVLWASETPVNVWEKPLHTERALLVVRSRLSAVLNVLFSLKGEAPIAKLLYGLTMGLFLVEIISVYIGVSVTRSITGAVHQLYEGTQRVIQGDFSHRIPVQGDDQITELSRSFNKMTENLENLLLVAKEKQRMEAELEIARQVQSQLFPQTVPVLKNLQLKAFCNPARMVSGDYYDYQTLTDRKVTLALGDVAGKGASAALLMASLQACLRMQVQELKESHSSQWPAAISTSRMMSRFNAHLYANTSPEKYATFFLSVYDDQSGLFVYTNAGHLPPLLIRGGQAKFLDVNGLIVGAFPFAQYEESSFILEPGDLLVAYTDGITEPENEFGEMFGEQRLAGTLLKCGHLDNDGIVRNVIESVQAFTGSPELQDDMTLVVARRL